MFLKRGSIESLDQKNPVLITPEGNRFKVSYVSAFVWEQLDGTKPIPKIKEKIERTGKLEVPNLSNFIEKIIAELEKVDLARYKK